MGESIIIVGAGIAGLSAGCYGQMNKYQTTIFEMHNKPGGLCTAWKRNGYTFDISMHMLTGSKTGPAHRMWHELGVLENRTFHYHKEIIRVESGEKCLTICTDPIELERRMTALSPDDAPRIKAFVQYITGKDMMGAMQLKPPELIGIFDKLKAGAAILPHLGAIYKYGKMTVQEFALGFKDPFLQTVVRFMIDAPGWPMLNFPMIAMKGMIKSSVMEAGVPLGGSQQVVYGMAEYYKRLGGEIHYKKRVVDLVVDDDRAIGVVLEDGSKHFADIVVWAGDGHKAIFDILGGRYIDEELKKVYNEWIPVLPLVQVMLGVNRDFSDEPHRIVFDMEHPITIAGEEHHWMCFLHHCFDPSMAPLGKSAVEVWFATRYDFWEELAKDKDRYDREKKRIADVTIVELEKRWPGFSSQVEVVDVPTPVTYHRYTGNWQGSPDGWYVTLDNMMRQAPLKRLPGLLGFYMIGQWTMPFTGTVIAALTGRQLIHCLCIEDGRAFVSDVR